MIEISSVSKTYPIPGQDAPALRDVSLRVEAGEFIAITGRSGSGKTTLLNIVGGLDRAYTGRVVVDGRDLAALGDRDLSRMRNRTMGFVFQAFHLLPRLSVMENVLLPDCFGRSREESGAAQRARSALDRVGLSHKAAVRPTQLSAGERQRVALARAILNGPRLLLCDEPTGNLDSATGAVVLDLLVELNRRDGMTMLIATHQESVSRAAGREVVLEAGRVVSERGAA